MTITVVGRECRFAIHVPPNDTLKKDYHFVKEQVHYSDGTIVPAFVRVDDYMRSFYVTKPGLQNHKDKKESELLSNVITYTTTQTNLRDLVAKAIGKGWSRDNMRRLSNSPYLYGSDISSTSCIKQDYINKNPDLRTSFTTASFDIEYDVINNTNEIILITVAMGAYTWTGVTKYFVKGLVDPVGMANAGMIKHLSEYVDKRKLKSEFVVLDSEIDLVKAAFEVAHTLKPDWLSIWNMDYDIPKVLEACKKVNLDPKFLFSDPSVPDPLKFFNYKQGRKKKVTVSGKVTPISPAAQWHTVEAPSSFYVIDAMCAFKQIRTGQPEERSYSLNAILNSKLGIRKLHFKETDQYSGLQWHQVMQSDYKIEYMIYNVFDCVSMLELDEVTNDLSFALPLHAGASDFSNFSSQPKRAVDKLHFYFIDNGSVIGSTGSDMTDEADEETLGLSGWISCLPAHLVVDNGLKCITEFPGLSTSARLFVAD